MNLKMALKLSFVFVSLWSISALAQEKLLEGEKGYLNTAKSCYFFVTQSSSGIFCDGKRIKDATLHEVASLLDRKNIKFGNALSYSMSLMKVNGLQYRNCTFSDPGGDGIALCLFDRN